MQPGLLYVHNPVVRDAGCGVKLGLGVEVEGEAAVGHLDHQPGVGGAGVGLPVVVSPAGQRLSHKRLRREVSVSQA